MKTRIKLQAMGPISHGAFGISAGNAVCFRREQIVSLPGFPRVPVISGNALRGVLRRIVFRDLFHRAGACATTIGKPWDKLYAALANGGHLTGSEKSVKCKQIREIRESLPPLSVFGAAMYTYMLPGHMSIGFCWPRCSETAEAGVVMPGEYPCAEELIAETSLCRHIERESQDPAESKVTPMPTTFEVLATGTILESQISFAHHATAAEIGAVAYALDGLEFVGAKAATGFGRVEVEHDLDARPYVDWLASTDMFSALKNLADKL